MRLSKKLTMLLLLMSMLIGCGKSGPEMLKTRGQVMKGGESFIPDDGQILKVIFSPISPDGRPPSNLYVAAVNQDNGTFVASGPRGEGMPPGKYRVSVELVARKKDLFDGRFDLVNSPLIFEIDADSPPLILDIEDAFKDDKQKSASK